MNKLYINFYTNGRESSFLYPRYYIYSNLLA